MPQQKRVLFLCTGNSARSQMAETLMRHLGGDRVEVVSAGTEPADRVNPLAVAVMAERGLDASAQYPKLVNEFLDQEFDYLISTCDGAKESCPFFAGARRRLHWGLPDPAAVTGTEEERLAAFRRTADELEKRIRELLRDM